jgi:hypothetical protein
MSTYKAITEGHERVPTRSLDLYDYNGTTRFM